VSELSAPKSYPLKALVERFALEYSHAEADPLITAPCALAPGRSGGIAFAEHDSQAEDVRISQAEAIVVTRSLAEAAGLSRAAIVVSPRPRLTFARIAGLFERVSTVAGIHPSAIIDGSANIAADVSIGAHAVVEAAVSIGAGTVIAAGAVIGAGATVGEQGRIGANACLLSACVLGDRVSVEPGAVIGARGFGLVPGPEGMEAVPQLGRVRIGDDVEIGANSTIDRGALDDTIIHDRVKIDNQVHIAHNCVIGAHTVIAGCTGIAGSCVIGQRCLIGGGVGIGDHVLIADDVIITAASQVPKHINSPGVYSSTFRAMPARSWRKRLALFRALDRIEGRLRRIEDKN
jgi:UDP-3-O-[3-hydroxymyristoyl] glucosamine N-acyltransferase